jgi:hypothetical protein
MSLIVAWTDLRPHFGEEFTNAKAGDELYSKQVVYRAALKKNPQKYSEETRRLKVVYRGVVPVDELVRASKGKGAHLFV